MTIDPRICPLCGAFDPAWLTHRPRCIFYAGNLVAGPARLAKRYRAKGVVLRVIL